MKRLEATLPVLLIVLAPMGMLYPLWARPTSAGEDDVTYYYPLRKMVGQYLREGRWPLHNPHEATGMPLMGDPQSAVMYPPTWLFAAVDAKLAYSLTLFLAFSVAGAGAYLYLRRLTLVRGAACFGAVAFMFCGFMVGHRVHWSILHVAAYLPWGLWCIEGLRSRPGLAFAAMVPAVYLALTAGHWPTVIHVGLIWSAYLLFRGRPFWRSVGLAVAAMVLAAALAGPQIDATRQVLAQATRNRIGYATAGENSFFPAAAVLGLFPMLMGSRTPNFYPQPWWGPWHLCEMLGYVGLVTLVLSLAAVRRMYRKQAAKGDGNPTAGAAAADSGRTVPSGHGPPPPGGASPSPVPALRPMVRVWTWIGAAAGVWMLGYYLPTYRLIHALPILGIIRCPARMVLAVDMALATLAAIAIHALASSPERERPLHGSIRRGATTVLPLAMLGTLAFVVAAAGISIAFFGGEVVCFYHGSAGWKALKALNPANPAVWVPVLLAAVTILIVRVWLAGPKRRVALLVVLVLLDLFFVTRFVDVPASDAVAPDPAVSPAAAWLRDHAPEDDSFCVWGIGKTYHDRPAELLRPKTAHSLGIATINTYGPFQSPAHSRLFGFRIFGTSRNWAWLIRRNHLLSLYGVRYILTARQDVRKVLESVRAATDSSAEEGPDLLIDRWWLDRARRERGVLYLQTPYLWRWSIAKQPVGLEPATVYRIALDARGPDGGAGNFLRAELFQQLEGGGYIQADELGLTAHAEEIGEEWRHFEWRFRTPDVLQGQTLFRVFTMSERPVEVRNISLRRSAFCRPLGLDGRLDAGEPVYRLAALLPPLEAEQEAIAVYENRLALGMGRRIQWVPATTERVEQLRWNGQGRTLDANTPLPVVGLRAQRPPRRALLAATLPAGVLCLLTTTAVLMRRRRSKQHPG